MRSPTGSASTGSTVRRRNLIAADGDAVYPAAAARSAPRCVYDSGDYALLLDKALARIGWDALQQDLRRRRDAGELVGAGLGDLRREGRARPARRRQGHASTRPARSNW